MKFVKDSQVPDFSDLDCSMFFIQAISVAVSVRYVNWLAILCRMFGRAIPKTMAISFSCTFMTDGL